MGSLVTRMLCLVLTGFLILTAGCRGGGDGGPPGRPSGTAVDVTVYFQDADGEFVPVIREVVLAEDTPENRLRAAVAEMLRGPGPDEGDLFSNFPEGVELLGLEISRPYATLDFNAKLEQMGGTMRVFGVIDQLTWTATALDEVSGVFLEVEGEPVGTAEHPFTGEGALFDKLYRPAAGDWAREASPAKCLESFMVTIGPNTEEMWRWMGPRARELWGTPGNVDWTALAEGLGSWRGYEVTEEIIGHDRARVTLRGDQLLEGIPEPGAVTVISMIRENGIWKWNLAE